MFMEKGINILPIAAINVDMLKQLCKTHHWAICAGEVPSELRHIRIRYVEGTDKFGYATFGDFFFFGDDLYVWKRGNQYAEESEHNGDVMECMFEDKCHREEYVCRFLYAGIETNYVDFNGENIFVGDVLQIDESDSITSEFAVGVLGDGDESVYCFILDNHYLSLQECVERGYKLTRIGTAYFQLDWNSDTREMEDKIREFNGWRDTTKEHNAKVLKARFTPNFDQEEWKYLALDTLEIEYNWR